MNHPYAGLSRAAAMAALNADREMILSLLEKPVRDRTTGESAELARYFQNVLMFDTIHSGAPNPLAGVVSHLLDITTTLHYTTAVLLRCVRDPVYRDDLARQLAESAAPADVPVPEPETVTDWVPDVIDDGA